MAKFRVTDWDRSTFPALYRSADDASTIAQRWYLRSVLVNLALLVLGAIVGSIPNEWGHKQAIQTIAAVCFFLALGTSLLLAFRRWDKIWYAGRAIAESVKSLTWKFVTGAEPFTASMAESEAVEEFTKSLEELLQENRSLAAALTDHNDGTEQVTSAMRQWRSAPLDDKRRLYLSARVDEQQRWYTASAKANNRYQNRWFVFLALCQATAGCIAVYLAGDADFPWRGAAVFSTLASAALAWGQVKRFQELAQAYGFAAQELSLIAARSSNVRTADELARFVSDAETAISREHSSWIARRQTK